MECKENIEYLGRLHLKILNDKFAGKVTENEILALVESQDLINRQEAENKEIWEERNRIYENLKDTKTELRAYREAYKNAQAEIERKTTQLDRLEIYMDELVRQRLNSAKSEVIKELAERVNQCKEINPDSMDGELIIYAQDFDNLAKELVREEDEGNG